MSLSTREAGGAHDPKQTPVIAKGDTRATRGGRGGKLPGIVTLARWRVRQTWRLLVITGLGMGAAVMLVCAVPLYSDVSQSAGLRDVISSSYQNSDIIVNSQSGIVSRAQIDQTTQSLNAEFQDKLGPYLKPVEFSVSVPNYLPIYGSQPTPCSGLKPPFASCNLIELLGASMEQAQSHLHLIQGRLPQDNEQTGDNMLEIALTQEGASALHLTVGSILRISYGVSQIPIKHIVRLVTLHVVGIFNGTDLDNAFWHDNTFPTISRNSPPGGDILTALVANKPLLTLFSNSFAEPQIARTNLDSPIFMSWYYPLNPSNIVVGNINDIINKINEVQVDVSNNPAYNQGLNLEKTTVVLPSDILQRYHDRIAVAQVPVLSMLAFVLALVLFFVSMMSDFLVERQYDSISILRSRGASRLQLLGAFTVQSIALGVVALIAGPLLAVTLVFIIIQRTVSAADQGALSLIAGNPGSIALNLGGYALIALVASIIAMVISMYRAMQLDILAARREAARATRRPIWQRINLDIVAIIIALVGFAFSYYVLNVGLLDPQLRLLLLSPLTLLRTVFLLIACLLIFLRLFQLLLRLGASLAARGRSATPVLALAQMARAPRQSSRMTMLFALATAFVIFAFIFNASQQSRVPQVAAFQAGADFSGVPQDMSFSAVSLDENTAMFQAIPGVASVTLGYNTTLFGGGSILNIPLQLEGVDANTYANTAGPDWTSEDSAQSLSSLMSMLIAHRKEAEGSGVIPAIVDSATWQNLHLSFNKPFALDFVPYGPLIFTPIAEVNLIPTIRDSVAGGDNGNIPSGGLLVDYRSLAAIYITTFAQFGIGLPLNYAWVRSHDDAASISSVRKALNTGCCTVLTPIYDRRAIISSLQSDPLTLDLIGVLVIGAATAMLLALAGSLIASWLSVRARLTNFVVLRALGASMAQIAGILTWEQTIIYLTSILLGLLCGALLSLLALPSLIFTSVTTTGATSDTSSGAFFVLQNVPPIQLVIPASLLIVLGVLIGICIVTLAIMIRVVARPSIGQMLRLNAD